MLGWVAATTLVVAAVLAAGASVAAIIGIPGRRELPGLFLLSTALLVVVSVGLAKSEEFAKRERQAKLHHALLVCLAAALAFLVVQALALNGLVQEIAPKESAVGPAAFIFAAIALHALHVAAGVLWLIYVTLRGFAGSYDHESRLGLTLCAWCWHALGVVWIVILAACLATV